MVSGVRGLDWDAGFLSKIEELEGQLTYFKANSRRGKPDIQFDIHIVLIGLNRSDSQDKASKAFSILVLRAGRPATRPLSLQNQLSSGFL